MGEYGKSRLKIVVGAYGSGKSELSVNLALELRRNNPDGKVLMADLDIVNPFYRSADAGKVLEENGIRLISPMYANSNVDAPVLSGEVYVIFDDDSYTGVFDIGGEDMGATVLGSMKTRLNTVEPDLLMAVNIRRPFTQTVEEIIAMARELEDASGLKITGFVNNTNLLEQTTAEDIFEGEEVLLKASSATGIPLVMTSFMEGLLKAEDMAKLKAPYKISMRRTINYAY